MRRRPSASGIGLVALALAGCGSDSPAPAAPSPRTATPSKALPAPPAPAVGDDAPDEAPPVRDDGTMFGTAELMGTAVSLNVFVGEGSTAKAGKAMQAALDEMSRIEDIMSEWRPGSEVSRLSDAAGGPAVKVSPELLEVLQHAATISTASNGAFDVTFHGVGQLWSFKDGATPPTREAIAAKLPLVDHQALELDGPAGTARLAKPGMRIGLGAIAKGYAVDRASTILRAQGFPDHVVEAGGDTFASGTKNGAKWKVGVQDPDSARALGFLEVSGQAVVTSGDYQRYFEHEGVRYAHILDPATGWPLPQAKSPKSVTAVAANATDADAYCTAIAVMGPERGMAFVEAQKDVEAVIITPENAVRLSSGLADNFVAIPAAQ